MRTYFTSLRLGLINSLSQLENTFVAQFIGAHLVLSEEATFLLSSNCSKGKRITKSFRDPLHRMLEGFTSDQVMHAMQDGLRDKDFIQTITKNLLRTFSNVLVEAQKYTIVEEVIK